MRVLNTINGLRIMASATKIFNPKEHFQDKRIAVIGPADSAFDKENGDYINGFDYVVRVNKALYSLTQDKTSFIGSRTDVLFHSFFENRESGGGPIDFDFFEKQGVKYVVNPNNSLFGLKTHLSYFKRNLDEHRTYLLPRNFYQELIENFEKWVPTIGYSALYAALNSGASEVYISGFTFFKTPYADDYRDHFQDVEENQKHIQDQDLHSPDLELKEFIKQYKRTQSRVIMDDALKDIVKQYNGSSIENQTH